MCGGMEWAEAAPGRRLPSYATLDAVCTVRRGGRRETPSNDCPERGAAGVCVAWKRAASAPTGDLRACTRSGTPADEAVILLRHDPCP